MTANVLTFIKGGPGSGHFGHAGRPGKRGGSLPGRGTGAAMSVLSGKYARVRQYLRGQGLSKWQVNVIIRSGAADTGALDLVGHKGGILKKAGIVQVQPHVDAYKKGEISKISELIERLGGDPLYRPGKKGVQRLPKSQQLQEQMQARINVGKPQVGDMFRFNNPAFSEEMGVFEVIEVDYDQRSIVVLYPNGDTEDLDPEADLQWRNFGKQFGRTEYGHERVTALVDHKFSLYERINRAKLEVGDLVGEKDNPEGPFEVIDVNTEGDAVLMTPGGTALDFDHWDVREYLEPWSEKRVVPEWPQGFNRADVSQDQLGRSIDLKVVSIIDPRTPLDVSTGQLQNMVDGPVEFFDNLSKEADRNGKSKSRVGQLEDGTMIQLKDAGWGGHNRGERLYYELSNAVGATGMVSQATIRESTGEAVRTWVEGKSWRDIQRDGEGGEYAFLVDERDFEVMAIMDVIAGATDRHEGNIIIQESGQLIVIDNDFAFDGRQWNFDTYQQNIEQYFQNTARHYYKITGDYLNINSGTIRQMADYAKEASVLQEHIDLEGSSMNELDMFKKRVTDLYKYADMLDEEWGGDKRFD